MTTNNPNIATTDDPAGTALGAVVSLSGGRSMETFSKEIARAPMDLPIDGSQTLGTRWQSQVASLAAHLDVPSLDLVVVGGEPVESAGGPIGKDRSGPVRACRFFYVPDPSELRGTGGVLRDLAERFADDQLLLVSTGATVLLEPLEDLYDALLAAKADVAFIVHEEEASNLMLVRCGSLRELPAVGFVDFKEQAVPRIKSSGPVIALTSPTPAAMTMRNASQYLEALRRIHNLTSVPDEAQTAPSVPRAFRETWMSSFAIVEQGADVDATATIHDSVVLRGAKVGRRALVARSVVSPNMVVSDDETFIGRVLSSKAAGEKSDGRWERS